MKCTLCGFELDEDDRRGLCKGCDFQDADPVEPTPSLTTAKQSTAGAYKSSCHDEYPGMDQYGDEDLWNGKNQDGNRDRIDDEVSVNEMCPS